MMRLVPALVLSALFSPLLGCGGGSDGGAGGGGLTPDPLEHAVVHYRRTTGDYGDPTTGDFRDHWGLHLWGDAIDPAEGTDWTAPKPFLGADDFGRFAWIRRGGAGSRIDFILHRGDVKDGTDADRSFDADETPEIWLRGGDPTVYTNRADAQGFATIHYHRDGGDYGTPGPDFHDFWGLHAWDGAQVPTSWTSPLPWERLDTFGAVFEVDLIGGAPELAYILHRGETQDPGSDQRIVLDRWGYEVWQVSGSDAAVPYVYPLAGR